MKILKFILNLLFLPLFIFLAIKLVENWIDNKPEPITKKPPAIIPRANYLEVSAGTHTPVIRSFGNTRSHLETQLSTQVAGEILHLSPNFDVGNTVQAGDLLLEINPIDFQIAITQAESNVAEAQQILAEEETRSRIAADDWLASGRKLVEASDFTLRKPQLVAAKANLKSTQSALKQAQINQSRTQIRAPFDAIVATRSASPGTIVSIGSSLGSLVSSDKTEVRIPLTPEQIQQAQLPNKIDPNNSQPLFVKVKSPSRPNATWQAQLVRTEPSVDPQNQVIFYLAEISAPFADPQKFLPLGAFVTVEIPGKAAPESYQVPNNAFVEDRFLWLIDGENKLQQLSAQRLFTEGSQVVLSLKERPPTPFRIATRPLASFREGQIVTPVAIKATASPSESP